MRQVIIGADVTGPASAANGAAIVHVLGADGVPVNATVAMVTAAVATDSQVRIARAGVSALSGEHASMWFKPSAIKSFIPRGYAVAAAQVRAFNFSAGGAVGDVINLKVILTTPGYEPFRRYNFEVKLSTGTSAANAATDSVAVIQAAMAAGQCPEIAVCEVATAAVKFTLASGELMEFAFDAGSSAAVMVYTGTGAVAMTKGIGVAAELKKEELLLQGIDNSNYDRYTVFADETYTYSATGETYNEYVLNLQNEALGQIRGVDNARQIKVAIPTSAGTYSDGESKANTTGETFSRLMEALTGAARVGSSYATPADQSFGCLNGD